LSPSPNHGRTNLDIICPSHSNFESSPSKIQTRKSQRNIPSILRSPQFRSVHLLNLPLMPQTVKGNSAPNLVQNRIRTAEEEFLATKMPAFETDNSMKQEGNCYDNKDQREKRRNIQRMKIQSDKNSSNERPPEIRINISDDRAHQQEANETFGVTEDNRNGTNIMIIDDGFSDFSALKMTGNKKGISNIENDNLESKTKELMGSGEYKIARVKSGGTLDQKAKFPKEIFGINMKKRNESRK